jgi:hypothetical protein
MTRTPEVEKQHQKATKSWMTAITGQSVPALLVGRKWSSVPCQSDFYRMETIKMQEPRWSQHLLLTQTVPNAVSHFERKE